MENTETGQEIRSPEGAADLNGRVRLIGYVKRHLHERKTKKEHESPVDRAARITANATVWIAVFTVVMALVGLGTLWEIIEGGTDTHDLAAAAKAQAEKMKSMSEAAEKIRIAAEGMVTQEKAIAENAKTALDASNRNSKTALDAAIATSRLDQRPWVLPKSFKLSAEPATGNPMSVEIDLVNTGKTPGIEVIPEAQIGLQYSCEMTPTMQESKEVKVKSRGILPPGQFDARTSSDPISVTEAMFTSYNGGVTRVIAQGLIRYTDEFHVPHWTLFRVFHEHGTSADSWSYCASGNGVDLNQYKKKVN